MAITAYSPIAASSSDTPTDEVAAADPLTYAAVALGLAVVGLLATFIPARRATRIDPLAALRHE
jgi:putative ABC transport system permease protein